MNKLNKYCINDIEHAWFQSCLNNRKQVVSYNNISSSAGNINAEVPQGTVLGSILFLIYYMNDLPNIKDHCIMYADDITLFYSSKNFSEATTKLQNIASKMVGWIEKKSINHKGLNQVVLFFSRYRPFTAVFNIYIKNVKINPV